MVIQTKRGQVTRKSKRETRSKLDESERAKSNKVKLCPKCANQDLIYSAGIDIGMIYASCGNCGYRANSNAFPDISKKEASKIKVIKGNKLAELQSNNLMHNKISSWTAAIVIIVLISVFLAFLL